MIAHDRSWLLLNNEKSTRFLLQVVCILFLDISLVEELVGACFLEGGPQEGAADQEHLLYSKRKKVENLKKMRQSVGV